jgi:hypothetical protein
MFVPGPLSAHSDRSARVARGRIIPNGSGFHLRRYSSFAWRFPRSMVITAV